MGLMGSHRRLVQLLRDEKRTLSLDSLQAVVLDEADRLLTQSYFDFLHVLWDALPKERSRLRFLSCGGGEHILFLVL